jgi:hypothetical protein
MTLVRGPEVVGKDQETDKRILGGSWARPKSNWKSKKADEMRWNKKGAVEIVQPDRAGKTGSDIGAGDKWICCPIRESDLAF